MKMDCFGNTQNSTPRKFLMTTALVAGVMLVNIPVAKAVDSRTTPTGENVIGGSASFDRPAEGRLDITQSSERAVIEWDNFDIGSKARTEFFQPGSSALAVNRVVGADSDPTQILGTLKANGRVMVLDRNGVFFGNKAVVDVGGIIASTGEIDDSSVMNGDTVFTFENLGPGAIENRGNITVDEAGLAAFVAPVMRNAGAVTAKLGKVTMAAGDSVTLDFYGDNLVEIDVGQDDFLARNNGKIRAEGGVVTMSALTASNVVGSIINMDGIVDVSSVNVDGGRIILSGGTENDVTVNGKLQANGENNGGDIQINAANINLNDKARLNVDSADGNGGDIDLFADSAAIIHGRLSSSGATGGGDILIDTDGAIVTKKAKIDSLARDSGTAGTIQVNAEGSNFDLAGRMRADGAEGGGDIIVTSMDSNVGTSGRISAQGLESGAGGLIALDALNNNESAGQINASGTDGGGLVRLRGSTIDVNGRIDARATESGRGGDISILSNGTSLTINDRLNASGIDGGGTVTLENIPLDVSENSILQITEEGRVSTEAVESGTGGDIVLNAVLIDHKGWLDSRGADGGGLVDLAAFDTSVFGRIDATATNSGTGGTINLDNDGDITIIGRLNASGVDGGGVVSMTGDDAFLQPESRIDAEGTDSGVGGVINIDTVGEIGAHGLMNVDGRNGGGDIDLVSGFVTLSGAATANATRAGDGGSVHLQGENSNIFSGNIEAKGGPVSGDGGVVTIDDPSTILPGSSVDVSAPNGNDGTFNH